MSNATAPPQPPLAYTYFPGWNVIGFVTQQPTRSVASYLSSLAGKWTVIYSYDQANGWRAASPNGEGFTDLVIGRGATCCT